MTYFNILPVLLWRYTFSGDDKKNVRCRANNCKGVMSKINGRNREGSQMV